MVDVKVTSNPKPGSIWKTVLGVLIVLGLIAGAIYYYAWPKGEGDDSPPVLGPSVEDQLQGLTILEDGLMKVDGKDPSHVCGGGKYVDVPIGVTYFYSDEEVSFKDVIKAIKPGDAEVLIAYYNVLGNSPYKSKYSGDEGDKNFYVYPIPKLWQDKVSSVPEDELSEYTFPPYFVFMILVDKHSTQLCADKFKGWKDEIDLGDQLPGKFFDDWKNGMSDAGLVDGPPVGWVLLPFNQDDLADYFIGAGVSEGWIEAVWTQTDVNAAATAKDDSDFTELDIEDFVAGEQDVGNYQMVWIKFKEPEAKPDVDYLDVLSASTVDAKTVKVTFDEDVDAATLVKENFTLAYSDKLGDALPVTDVPAAPPGQKITDVKAGAVGSNSVLLTLDSDMDLTMPDNQAIYYKVTVSSVKSKEGDVLSPAETFAVFKYELPAVETALTCALDAENNPAVGTISVGLHVELLDFSCISTSDKAITLKELTFEKTGTGDVGGLTSLRILNSVGKKVGQGEFIADGKATAALDLAGGVTVHPKKSVDLAVWVTVGEDAKVGDTYGVKLTGVIPTEAGFTVGGLPLEGNLMTVGAISADTTKPKVLEAFGVVAADGANAETTMIVVRFDEPLDVETVFADQFKVCRELMDDGKCVGEPPVASMVVEGQAVTLVIEEAPFESVLYEVTALDGIKDLAGNIVDPDNDSAQFVYDSIAPEMISAKAIDATHVEVTFDDIMELKADAVFKVAPLGGVTVHVESAVVMPDFKVVLLTLFEELTSGLEMSVSVISGVTDEAGNKVFVDETVQFMYSIVE